jgi:hypothetical protein
MGKKHAKRKLRHVTYYSPESPDWGGPESPCRRDYESPDWMYRDSPSRRGMESPERVSPEYPGIYRMPRTGRAYCDERYRSCMEGCRRYYERGEGRYRGCSVRCMTNYMYCDGTTPYPMG